MNDRLRISVSGIRGRVPDALNVEVASKFASAFSSYLEHGRIAVCRDSRYSSQMLAMAVVSSIIAAGLESVDFGELPVSFLQFHMKRQIHSGGIAVSGGHNPLPWNAIVLLNEAGFYLESTEGPEVFNIYESGGFKRSSWQDLGSVKQEIFPIDSYLEEMGRFVNMEKIRKAGFKIVADPCNGVLSPFLDIFAGFFNLRLIAINNNIEGPFAHPPEPCEENASQVEAVVKAGEANLGFLLNSDGSRISFVDEKGKALSEEFTLPLCLLSLQNKIKKAVSTTATSSLVEWAAQRAGIKLIRTKVGQSAVVHTMETETAEGGGEGSGGFAYLPFSPGYDSLFSLALVLDYMVNEQKSISELVAPFPCLWRKKIKIKLPPVKIHSAMEKLETFFAHENLDFTDGIRVTRDKAWFIIRPSTTEFILRIMIEGNSKEINDSIEEEIIDRLES